MSKKRQVLLAALVLFSIVTSLFSAHEGKTFFVAGQVMVLLLGIGYPKDERLDRLRLESIMSGVVIGYAAELPLLEIGKAHPNVARLNSGENILGVIVCGTVIFYLAKIAMGKNAESA